MAVAGVRPQRAGADGSGADQVPEEPLRWLVRLVLLVALVLIGVWTVQRTTWYLAIDQFGYLTFAEDLSHGDVSHDWELLPALGPLLPAGLDVDVYAQTYIRRGDSLFCRYSPGFPLILAAARLAFGPAAEHYVNPPALVLLLLCTYLIGRRIFRSSWLGLAAALLVALLPNYVLLWSTSPLRDVPAHMLAFCGLLILLPGARGLRPGWRELVAGLVLGFAVTTRNDAVLYLLPAGAIGLLDRAYLPRRVIAAAVGLTIGVAPLLAYNYMATGNPLRATQAMELDSVLSKAPGAARERSWTDLLAIPSTALAAEDPENGATILLSATPAPRATPFRVQGGGLRLSNLGKTLPANVAIVRETFGDLPLVLALVGAVVALRTPALFLLTVPYSVVAFLFFSLWTLPGPRYLSGVLLLLPLLVLEGARALAKAPAALGARWGRGAGSVALVGVALAVATLLARTSFESSSALPWVTVVLALGVAIGAALGTFAGTRWCLVGFALAIGLGLTATLLWRSTATLGVRASFQAPQVERARGTIESTLDLPAVVLTTTSIGRPAENLNYYTPVQAVYLEEMVRWQVQPRFALGTLLRRGFAVYLLTTPDAAKHWLSNTNISTWYTGDVVRRISPSEAADFFVASPYHRGIPLVLVRLEIKPGA